MCAGIHRSGTSRLSRQSAAMPGCTKRFSFCPRAGSWTSPPREGLDVKRSELDLLSVQSWVAIQNLLCPRSLAQHVGNQCDGNTCPTINGRATHNLRVGNNHILSTLKFLQVQVELPPHRFDLNHHGRALRKNHRVNFRRGLNLPGDRAASCERQEPHPFRLESQIEHLAATEHALDGTAGAEASRSNQATLDKLMNRGEGQVSNRCSLRRSIFCGAHSLILPQRG